MKKSVIEQISYGYSDISDKDIRAVHMAGCAVMAYVVRAEKMELDLKRNEARVTCRAFCSEESEMMLRYAGEGAEQLLCGTGRMECMEKDFDYAALLFKKVSSINKAMHYAEAFPTEEEMDRYTTIGKKCIQREVQEALKAYKGAISYLAAVLLKKKRLKTEEIRERIEAYVAGEDYSHK